LEDVVSRGVELWRGRMQLSVSGLWKLCFAMLSSFE
jgi:hypothetical protein